MKIQIKNRFNYSVIFETDAETIGGAVKAALASKAYLCGAILRGANLRDADLCGANLRDADLCGANLRDADLRDADLRDADLRGADLRDADLRGANLRDADLRGAKVTDNDLLAIASTRTIVPAGELIGWKKLKGGTICNLKIPADAKRVGGVIGRKCRASYAVVLEGSGRSQRNSLEYKVGEEVRPDSFDPNPLVECSNGIHFFITREEAEAY